MVFSHPFHVASLNSFCGFVFVTGKKKQKKPAKKSKAWVLMKKASQAKKLGAATVRKDTKYTGRRRPRGF